MGVKDQAKCSGQKSENHGVIGEWKDAANGKRMKGRRHERCVCAKMPQSAQNKDGLHIAMQTVLMKKSTHVNRYRIINLMVVEEDEPTT